MIVSIDGIGLTISISWLHGSLLRPVQSSTCHTRVYTLQTLHPNGISTPQSVSSSQSTSLEPVVMKISLRSEQSEKSDNSPVIGLSNNSNLSSQGSIASSPYFSITVQETISVARSSMPEGSGRFSTPQIVVVGSASSANAQTGALLSSTIK